jgi:formylglycine-generating enzyme required for sulfatase activity
VSWEDARAFCAWAGGSLPSEALWERAARGDDARTWPWGDEPPTAARACHAETGPAPVGDRPDGAGPFGHLDLAGNVWEWTSSSYAPYPYDGRDRDGARVVRGGSYIHGPGEVRCSFRQGLLPGVVDPYVGFRVAEAPGVDALDVSAGTVAFGNDPRPSAGPALPDETPLHELDVAAAALSATPVTNAQYQSFVQATGHPAPAQWPEGGADHPVTHVDWHDAVAFCTWPGVRLPTESEWEKAARGADGRLYPWGSDEPGPGRANAGAGMKRGGTSPVGAHPAGASPYRLLDMAGNVWEWVSSAYRPYPYRADDGREDPATTEERVLRGGSFASPTALHVRCASRSHSHRGRRAGHIGFRVAR